MTYEELLARVCTGRLVLVGELRAADVREAGFVDKKTGLAALTKIVTYFVEVVRGNGPEYVKVTRRAMRDGAELTTETLGVEKGRYYAFEIQTIERKPGFLMAWMADEEPEEVRFSGAPLGAPSGAPAAHA